MSAATVLVPQTRTPARPGRAGLRAAAPAHARPARPRLLLPPLVERPSPQTATDAARSLLPRLRSVREPAVEEAWPHDPRTPAAQAELPDPRHVCGPLVLTAVEALQGGRPLAQLVRWVSPELYDRLSAVAQAPDGSPRRRITVLRTVVCRVDERVVEASVVVHDGVQVRAAAVRLEAHRGRWRATVLQIG